MMIGVDLAAASDNQGNIYAIGGIPDGTTLLNTVEVYSPTLYRSPQIWSSAPPMPTARYGLAAATDANGNIYAIGGVNGPLQSAVERYTPPVTIYTFIKN